MHALCFQSDKAYGDFKRNGGSVTAAIQAYENLLQQTASQSITVTDEMLAKVTPPGAEFVLSDKNAKYGVAHFGEAYHDQGHKRNGIVCYTIAITFFILTCNEVQPGSLQAICIHDRKRSVALG